MESRRRLLVCITLSFVLVLLAASCSSRRANIAQPPPPPPASQFPTVGTQAGQPVGTTGGALDAPAEVQDPTSGASASVPAGTQVATDDPRYDTDGDGIADEFAPSVGPINTALAAIPTVSTDGGETFSEVTFVGGATFEPTDAQFDQPVVILIPVGDAGGAVGSLYDIWWYAGSRTTSQAAGPYWALAGSGYSINVAAALAVPLAVQRFGAYGLSLHMGSNRPPSLDAISATPAEVLEGAQVALTCTATDPDGDTLSYQWSGGGTFGAATTANSSWQSPTAGTYSLSCEVSDGQGHAVSSAVSVVVTGGGSNQAPVITNVSATPASVLIGENASLSCTANDEDGDPLTYAWSGPGAFADASQASTTWSHSDAGIFTLVCTVSDGNGGQAADSVQVTVSAPNSAPEVLSITATPTTVAPGDPVDLICAATDADGDVILYQWSGTGIFTTGALATTSWNHDTPGLYTLTCTIDDSNGGIAADSVDVTVVAVDLTPPDWDTGDAGLSVDAREGFVLVMFNSASDTESDPVKYSLYYDETGSFDTGTATRLYYETYPAMPVRIDGLVLGTDYTFGVSATDSAPTSNVTPLASLNATPQPYYDDVPPGGHDFGTQTMFADVASPAGRERAVMVTWADEPTGVLRQGYYTDGAWVVRTISTASRYVLPGLFFKGQLPVVVAADDSGNLDMFVQQPTGDWTQTNLFQRAGVVHVTGDGAYDPVTMTAYIGHATETPGPGAMQTIHFVVVDMSGPTPVVSDTLNDVETDFFIPQVRISLDAGGDATLIYSHGVQSFSQAHELSTELAFAAYSAGTGLTTTAVTTFNPLYFDVRPDGIGGWDLLVTDGVPTMIGSYGVTISTLKLANGSGASWTSQDIFTMQASLGGTVIDYESPMECVLAPSIGTAYYARATGSIDIPTLATTGVLSLWSWVNPGPSVAEPGNNLSRMRMHGNASTGFVVGTELASFDFETITNQLDFPPGNLILRELP